jgi:hypothetical protein
MNCVKRWLGAGNRGAPKVVLDVASEGTIGADEPDGIPVTGDPDNDIDPDDNLSCPDTISPLPEMPASWWGHLVADSDETPVSPEDCKLVLEFVGRRMRHGQLKAPATSPHRTSTEDGSNAPILTTEDKIAFGEAIAGITTVGELHSAIEEHFGPPGWSTLVRFWHATACIHEPTSITTRIPMSGLHPEAQPLEDHLPETGRTSPPSPASLQSEAEALRSLPGAVRRFWLHEPPLRPWRYSETGFEKEWRLDREGDGSWCG